MLKGFFTGPVSADDMLELNWRGSRELSHWRGLFRTLAGCTDVAYPNSKTCKGCRSFE